MNIKAPAMITIIMIPVIKTVIFAAGRKNPDEALCLTMELAQPQNPKNADQAQGTNHLKPTKGGKKKPIQVGRRLKTSTIPKN